MRKDIGQKDARKIRSIIYAVIIALVLSPAASAGMFDFLDNIFTPMQVQTPTPTISSWDQLTQDLMRLNTPANIQTLNGYLDRYGIQAVRIDVMDPSYVYEGSFYVTRDIGVNFQQQRIDRSFMLSERQVRDIMNMAQDGNLDVFEKIRIWAMLQ